MPEVSLYGRAFDALVLDCDGVILDSNGFKINAFSIVALAQGFDQLTVSKFTTWQRENFGISRYRVFDELLSGKFGNVPDEVSRDGLLAAFGMHVRHGYAATPFAMGLTESLHAIGTVPLYVASGSDETELREVLQLRGLAPCFREILGSPRPKMELLSYVRRLHARVLMVGDAHADADAARESGCNFVFLSRYSTVVDSMLERSYRDRFPHFQGLPELIDAMVLD